MLTRVKKIFPHTIRGNILLSTAAVIFLIAAITVSVCFSVFQSFLQKANIQSTEFNLKVISNNVSADLKNILYFADWCTNNTDIAQYLEAFHSQTTMPSISSGDASLRKLALTTYERLKEEYNNTHSYDNIFRVVISPNNRHNFLQISNSYLLTSSAVADTLYASSYFQELLEAPSYAWVGLHPDPLLPYEEELFFPIVRPIYGRYNTKIVGWVYLSVSDDLLLHYIASSPLEEDSTFYLTIGEHSYLFTGSSFQESTLPTPAKQPLHYQSFQESTTASYVLDAEGHRRVMVSCPIDIDGWSISQLISTQAQSEQQQLYFWIIVGITLCILMTGLLLYLLLNRSITYPVALLKQKITAISQGDFSPDASIEWDNEFGTIGKGINRMAENVVSLMNKRVEDEKQKKDLEYQILQSQINPHFLYNTLNSIKWMATIQGASGIAEMTTSLSRLMKNVSKGTATKIALREELELVKDYFLIQQYRYGGSITLNFEIADEDLYRCQIHRFTLQPIVENALFHGIEPKGCAGNILIRAEGSYREDGSHLLLISVSDNGVGMTQENIEKVLRGDSTSSAEFFRQLGINNVNRRIQYEFGESYGISITSEVGIGTTMTITLPFLL
ncbi:MAG: sensor histidine kinase [bacterium]|nr:sensor histidine kinase [bacterium]